MRAKSWGEVLGPGMEQGAKGRCWDLIRGVVAHILGAKPGLRYQGQVLQVRGSRLGPGPGARPSGLGFYFPHQVQQFVQFCDLHSWTLLHFLALLFLVRREVHMGEEW